MVDYFAKRAGCLKKLAWLRRIPDGLDPLVLIGVVMASTLFWSRGAAAAARQWHVVAPQETDPRIIDNDTNDLAFAPRAADAAAPLLVFIGGGLNFEQDSAGLFLGEAARLGYHVVALDYRYAPPGTAVCEEHGEDPCFADYRAQKVFGSGSIAGITVAPGESIVDRLTRLLEYLARRYPDEAWEEYLSQGSPRWELVTLSGFSQGAGLAAFLAKRVAVARVALLSSPWDHYDTTQRLAGWLGRPGATPPQRWFGLYSAAETEAGWLAKAYAALGLEPDHIRVLEGVPRGLGEGGGATVYHWSVIGRHYTPLGADGVPENLAAWDFVLGRHR